MIYDTAQQFASCLATEARSTPKAVHNNIATLANNNKIYKEQAPHCIISGFPLKGGQTITKVQKPIPRDFNKVERLHTNSTQLERERKTNKTEPLCRQFCSNIHQRPLLALHIKQLGAILIKSSGLCCNHGNKCTTAHIAL